MTEDELAEVVARVKAELQAPEVNPLATNLGMFQVSPGQTITADHMNSALQTGVPKFASITARDAQWPAPPVGAMCYILDSNSLQVFDNQITGGINAWHVTGGVRMGYGASGPQTISPSVDDLVVMTSFGGAANKPGRGTWNADGTVTVPLTGTYLVTGNVTWPTNTSGERRLYIKRYTAGAWGFSGVSGGATETNVAGNSYLRQSAVAMVIANAGDKLALFARQNSGVALALIGGVDQPHMGVHLLGAE